MEMEFPIAYLDQSAAAVYFSKSAKTAGSFSQNKRGTSAEVIHLQNKLNVALWGEDNRFPQNIEAQMAYCGVGKSGLDWKARALYGNGIVPGKITGYEDEGKKEIFVPLSRTDYKKIYDFIEDRRMFRFWLEYFQDWAWFANCFPEIILSNDGRQITGLVHQESCDCRFQQMTEKGIIEKVLLSKLWGLPSQQYAKFDPDKKVRGLLDKAIDPVSSDNKYIKPLYCIDMYDAVQSLKTIAQALKNKKGLKSAILPTNYPSPNKTYYQVPYWDGARLGGWVELACKFPQVYKQLLTKAFRIKYHIEVPESYFEKLHGKEIWTAFTVKVKAEKRKELLQKMDTFLSGEKNAFKSFVSVFDLDPHSKNEYGRLKINVIDEKTSVDKEIILSSAADAQVLTAMQIHPTLFGSGTIGTGQQRTGGSDQREAHLIYTANLNLERNVALEPLYLVRDYNREVGGIKEWENDIVFRIRDTVLTTLDQGKGTEKTLS